jgi:hypothetical protein
MAIVWRSQGGEHLLHSCEGLPGVSFASQDYRSVLKTTPGATQARPVVVATMNRGSVFGLCWLQSQPPRALRKGRSNASVSPTHNLRNAQRPT